MPYKNPRFEVLFKKGEWLRRSVVDLTWTGGMPLVTFGLLPEEIEVAGGQTTAQILIDFMNAFLFENTGAFDKAGTEIMHGDICATPEGDLYSIVFYYGGFYAQKGEEEGKQLTDEFCRTLTVVGDVIRQSKLLIPDIVPPVLAEADKKANTPQTQVGNEVKKPIVITDFKR